jgi:RND superfamily putative drug exporter
MFGLGLTLAVLGDATLVRMLLVPAFMHVMGRFNWWSTPLLARLHRRLPMNEPRRPQDAPAMVRSHSD